LFTNSSISALWVTVTVPSPVFLLFSSLRNDCAPACKTHADSISNITANCLILFKIIVRLIDNEFSSDSSSFSVRPRMIIRSIYNDRRRAAAAIYVGARRHSFRFSFRYYPILFPSIDDTHKVSGFQRCATDKTTVDVGFCEEFGSIACLAASSVED